MVTTTFASSLLVDPAATTPSMLARVKVSSTKVCCSIVVGVVFLGVPTGLAIGKEGLLRSWIDTNPHLLDRVMGAVDVTAKLMFAAESLRVLCAVWTHLLWIVGADIRGL